MRPRISLKMLIAITAFSALCIQIAIHVREPKGFWMKHCGLGEECLVGIRVYGLWDSNIWSTNPAAPSNWNFDNNKVFIVESAMHVLDGCMRTLSADRKSPFTSAEFEKIALAKVNVCRPFIVTLSDVNAQSPDSCRLLLENARTNWETAFRLDEELPAKLRDRFLHEVYGAAGASDSIGTSGVGLE